MLWKIITYESISSITTTYNDNFFHPDNPIQVGDLYILKDGSVQGESE